MVSSSRARLSLLVACGVPLALGQARPKPLLPTDRQLIAKEITAWSNYRQRTILPSLMEQYNISAWVVASHEYNEDPAFWAIWPGVGLRNCTDPTAWVDDLDQACLNDQYNGDQITVFVYDELTGHLARSVTKDWEEVARFCQQALSGKAPGPRLVLNSGPGRFQGLLAGSLRALRETSLWSSSLKAYEYDPFAGSLVGIPHPLPWEFIELRVPPEVDATMTQRYHQLQETSREAQRYGLSGQAIRPGVTTTEDVNWLLVELAERELDLRMTSSPAVAIFRRGVGWLSGPRAVIQEGDMLRSDWGLKGFGDMLWSDNTVLAFVGAKPDPELLAGLAKANRLQEFWLESCARCVAQRCTGQEWVKDIERRMVAVNWTIGDEDCGSHGEPQCDGAIFSHPIGDFMHSTGPYIESAGGVYGRRRRGQRLGRRASVGGPEPAPPSSDWRALKARRNTWFSMELAAFAPWGETWAEFNLEQQVQVTSDGRCEPVVPLQRELFLVMAEEGPGAVVAEPVLV